VQVVEVRYGSGYQLLQGVNGVYCILPSPDLELSEF